MTVARFQQPDYTADQAASYKAKIDAAIAVLKRMGDWFAPHQVYSASPNPDWAVELDAGFIWNGTTLTEVAAQSVSGFTAPASGYVRIDRVVVDATTGVASRVAGTAETTGSPGASAPAIPAGKIPICQVSFTSSATAVTDSVITDERPFVTSAQTPAFSASYVSAPQTITTAGALTLAHGLGATPKALQLILQCQTGELGYEGGSPCDEVFINPGMSNIGSTDNAGVAVTYDATNIYIRYGNSAAVFYLPNKSSGSGGGITNANWRMIVRAWA